MMGGRSAMEIGGAWKRFGSAHCTGDARSENTGSVSQNSPASLSSSVEWPRRNRLASGAAASVAASSGCTGIGARGTVVSGFWVSTRQAMPSPFLKPGELRGATLWNLPSRRCGEGVASEDGAAAREDRQGMADSLSMGAALKVNCTV